MKDQYLIVELQPDCWLAPWSGDPGRTLVKESAKRFGNYRRAEKALKQAREYRPFLNARIVSEDEK